jgi:hypothetical protein
VVVSQTLLVAEAAIWSWIVTLLVLLGWAVRRRALD